MRSSTSAPDHTRSQRAAGGSERGPADPHDARRQKAFQTGSFPAASHSPPLTQVPLEGKAVKRVMWGKTLIAVLMSLTGQVGSVLGGMLPNWFSRFGT